MRDAIELSVDAYCGQEPAKPPARLCLVPTSRPTAVPGRFVLPAQPIELHLSSRVRSVASAARTAVAPWPNAQFAEKFRIAFRCV